MRVQDLRNLDREPSAYVLVPRDFIAAADALLRAHLQVADWDCPDAVRYRLRRAELIEDE